MSMAQRSLDAIEAGPMPRRPIPNRTRDVRATRLGKSYSRFVGLMKLILPLAAAALVIMVVAWPQFGDEPKLFRLDADNLRLGDSHNQKLINARYMGTNSSNQPYTITAQSAIQRPGDAETLDLEQPKADITANDGAWLALVASVGAYNKKTRVLELGGGVNVFRDDGYEFRTEKATVNLAEGVAHGARPVEGQGPFGTLQASGFRMVQKSERILFTGKARMVLYPQASDQGR